MDKRRDLAVLNSRGRLWEQDYGSSGDARWSAWIELGLERNGRFLARCRARGRAGVRPHLISEGFRRHSGLCAALRRHIHGADSGRG